MKDKTSKTNYFEVIFYTLTVIFIIAMIGYMIGYSARGKDQDKWDCQYKYGNVEQSKISGNCLKYFKK